MSKSSGKALDRVIQRNVETIEEIEKQSQDSRPISVKISDKIAAFCGSMTFVWVHIAWFGAWLIINGLPFIPKGMKFDPPPFGNLTLVVSLEAIFLSTFILISQNRQQEMADQRNELDLQINMLAEQEASHTILLLTALLKHHGIEIPDKEMSEALESDTNASKLAQVVKTSLQN